MRTLVLSDLHLGAVTRVDIARYPPVLEALLAEVARADRLVLLGDVIELRHGASERALLAAQPVLQAIGSALKAEAAVILIAGNHDHDLVRPWLDSERRPLELGRTVSPSKASLIARRIASWLGPPARTRVAYPGIWLREDIYALHGHYLDVHGEVPTFERLSAAVMTRIAGAPNAEPGTATVEQYERVLAPLYAWIHANAQRTPAGELSAGASRTSQLLEMLQGDGHRPIRTRVALRALPLGLRGLSALGAGPLTADFSPQSLLRCSIAGLGEVITRLGITAEHVIFGHSHRGGPYEFDDPADWRTASGTVILNTGSWVHEPTFTGAAGMNDPYWPGGVVLIEGDSEPRALSLLGGVRLPSPVGRVKGRRDRD